MIWIHELMHIGLGVIAGHGFHNEQSKAACKCRCRHSSVMASEHTSISHQTWFEKWKTI